MVYAMMGDLTGMTQAKAEAAAALVLSECSKKIAWDAVNVALEAPNPVFGITTWGVHAEVRYANAADRDTVAALIVAYLDRKQQEGIKGNVRTHTCSHDGDPSPCVEVVIWERA